MGLIKETHFVLFWTLVGGLAAGLIWNLPWRFQVNDDEVMMWLVSGAYTGSPESYAVFLHPVLSWAFSVLYQLAPQVLWYPVTWFLCMFLGFSVLVSQVKKKFGGKLTAHVWSLFFFAFYVHFLFFLQFSIVAGFAVFTGFVARFGHLEDQDRQKTGLHFTDLFILLGFLARPEVLFVFLTGVLVLNLVVVKSASLYRRSIPPILILVIGYGVSYVWVMNSGLQDFERLNRQRSSVFDHPVLQLNKEELKKENPDLYYFSNGLIDFQRDLQLIEKLPAWEEELDSKRWEWIGTESVAKSFLTYVEHEHFLLALIAVFLSFSLFFRWKKAVQISVLLALGMLVLSPFFLLKVQIYGLVFLILMMVVFSFLSHQHHSRTPSRLFISVLVVGIAFHFYSFFHSAANWLPAENLKEQLETLKRDGYNQVFLIGPGNLYSELLFENPSQVKLLGWPTLLEKYKGNPTDFRSAYLVDSATYTFNKAYFEKEELAGHQSGLYLLLSKK